MGVHKYKHKYAYKYDRSFRLYSFIPSFWPLDENSTSKYIAKVTDKIFYQQSSSVDRGKLLCVYYYKKLNGTTRIEVIL
jgi:hypothetical protein